MYFQHMSHHLPTGLPIINSMSRLKFSIPYIHPTIMHSQKQIKITEIDAAYQSKSCSIYMPPLSNKNVEIWDDYFVNEDWSWGVYSSHKQNRHRKHHETWEKRDKWFIRSEACIFIKQRRNDGLNLYKLKWEKIKKWITQ